jgi:CubicO group peptidase (beta-lactamase class C family)
MWFLVQAGANCYPSYGAAQAPPSRPEPQFLRGGAISLTYRAPPLPRSHPEAQGVRSSAILAFVDEADKKVDAIHSFMLLRHGQVVADCWWAPYDARTRHELYSLSKSFTSTAVGLAIAEGKLSIDDPVLKFFPEDAPPEPSSNLKAMRVHDLLRMSTGHQTEPSFFRSKDPWVKTFLAQPVPNKPGTHFLYNTAGTYMQSAIVQKATGQTVLDYLLPRLFVPLGIEPTWGSSPQGISLGGYGLSIKTEDIARFGQLYLQKGRWEERQLIPAAWVEAASARQTSNGSNPQSDWDQGYGYQFWRCRHGAYRGDGAFGQFCIVMPEQDAVVAITSGTKDLQGVLNLVWDKLLPAFSAEPLLADAAGNKKLEARLAGLMLPVQTGSDSARIPSDISEKLYTFGPNDQKIESLGLAICKAPEAATLLCKLSGGSEQRLHCGVKEWLKGRMTLGNLPEQPVAASGGWTEDNVFTAKLCFFETPYTVTLRMDFSGGKLRLDSSWNVSFVPAKKEPLIGERK